MKYILILLVATFLISSSPIIKFDKKVSTKTISPVKKEPKILFVFFNDADASMQKMLAQETSKFYGSKYEIDNTVSLPINCYYKERGRYRAEKLLQFLATKPGYDKVIGFTNKDISTTKGNVYDFGIFGLGACPGKTCVVSSFRLQSNYDKCLNVLIHEVGHTLGLPHCDNKNCIMTAGDATSNLNSKIILCSKCKNSVRW